MASADIQQQLKMGQQLVMTPQLQQAIKLLQLSHTELIDIINEEMEQNPLLEDEREKIKEVDAPKDREDKTIEVGFDEKIKKESDWEEYLNEYSSIDRVSYDSEKKESIQYENFTSKEKTLREHLLWQLMMSNISKKECSVGNMIISNLNKDGYFNYSLKEFSEKNSIGIKFAERVLFLIQKFDPVGVGARNLKECLMLQIKYLKIDDPLLITIVTKYLKELENKQYKIIAKKLKISIEDIVNVVKIIKKLEPKPGRIFNEEKATYVVPDIFVYKVDNEFIIVLNDENMPKLTVSKMYQDLKEYPDETKSYVQEKMKSASWLIKSINQRQRTIYNVVKSIFKFQRDFFNKGISMLKPMVLKDVAEDIEMHESTISRVTTNKYVHTPQGIFELKYFFNSSINRTFGETIASASVQDKIKQIIKKEPKQKPYSDEKIMEILKQSNVSIARRTVAKYRNILKILPANKRKQY